MGIGSSKKSSYIYAHDQDVKFGPKFQYPADYIRMLYTLNNSDDSTFSEYSLFLKEKCLESVSLLQISKQYDFDLQEQRFFKGPEEYFRQCLQEVLDLKGQYYLSIDRGKRHLVTGPLLYGHLYRTYHATFPGQTDTTLDSSDHYGAFQSSVFELNCRHAVFFGKTLPPKVLEEWYQEIKCIEAEVSNFNFVQFHDRFYDESQPEIGISKVNFKKPKNLLVYMLSELMKSSESMKRKFNKIIETGLYRVSEKIYEDLRHLILMMYVIQFWRVWKYRRLGVLDVKVAPSADIRTCKLVISQIIVDQEFQEKVTKSVDTIKVKPGNWRGKLHNFVRQSRKRDKFLAGGSLVIGTWTVNRLITKIFMSTPISYQNFSEATDNESIDVEKATSGTSDQSSGARPDVPDFENDKTKTKVNSTQNASNAELLNTTYGNEPSYKIITDEIILQHLDDESSFQSRNSDGRTNTRDNVKGEQGVLGRDRRKGGVIGQGQNQHSIKIDLGDRLEEVDVYNNEEREKEIQVGEIREGVYRDAEGGIHIGEQAEHIVMPGSAKAAQQMTKKQRENRQWNIDNWRTGWMINGISNPYNFYYPPGLSEHQGWSQEYFLKQQYIKVDRTSQPSKDFNSLVEKVKRKTAFFSIDRNASLKMIDYLPRDEPENGRIDTSEGSSLYPWIKKRYGRWVEKMRFEGNLYRFWSTNTPNDRIWYTRMDYDKGEGNIIMPSSLNQAEEGTYAFRFWGALSPYNYASQGGLSNDYQILPSRLYFPAHNVHRTSAVIYKGGTFGGLPIQRGEISFIHVPEEGTVQHFTITSDYWTFDYHSNKDYVIINGYIPGESPFKNERDIKKGERQTMHVKMRTTKGRKEKIQECTFTQYVRIYPMSQEFMLAQENDAYVRFAADGVTEEWSDNVGRHMRDKYPIFEIYKRLDVNERRRKIVESNKKAKERREKFDPKNYLSSQDETRSKNPSKKKKKKKRKTRTSTKKNE